MAGPFYFAFVDPSETTFNPSHIREDVDIFSFTVEHREGDVATLSMEIKNPLIGLLAPGRKVWAWLSWFNGSSVVPLFFGRIVGVPNDLTQEAVTLVFSARPANYLTTKAALAETMKVTPYYDPLWVEEGQRDDPDTVLEGYSKLWHVDRVTHAVTASDILAGEDGLAVFSGSAAFYDSVSIELREAPLTAVQMIADISWTQTATGTVDIRPPYFMTYSGDAIVSGWPKTGQSIQGGWSVASSAVRDDYNVGSAEMATETFRYESKAAEHVNGSVLTSEASQTFPVLTGPSIKVFLTTEGSQSVNENGQVGSASAVRRSAIVPLWRVSADLVLQYAASRKRKETVEFTLTADLQPIITLTDTSIETVRMSSADVGVEVDAVLPIGNASRRSFLPSPRGLQSLEYLICVARAHLLKRARAVQVKWECPFALAILLSCRMNARLIDRRLPGGEALGKIIAYTFSADGDTGTLVGSVTIGCAIGYGGPTTGTSGTPSYVDDGYVDSGYQFYFDSAIVLGSGDVSYSIPIDAPVDDGVVFPLSKSQAVLVETVHGDTETQGEAITALLNSYRFIVPSYLLNNYFQLIEEYKRKQATLSRAVSDVIKANPIWYDLQLRSVVNGPFEVSYAITLSALSVPKQVDLGATS